MQLRRDRYHAAVKGSIVACVLGAATVSTLQFVLVAHGERTGHGRPRLDGVWTYGTDTPLERPSFVTQQFFSDAEAREFLVALRQERHRAQANAIGVREYFDLDLPLLTVGGRTPTSVIFDPPNGHIPYVATNQQTYREPDYLSGPEDLSLSDRCIRSVLGPPMFPIYGEQFVEIFQTDAEVAFLQEANHEARIASVLPARPHVSGRIEEWLGDGRGRWEGDTLVIDTTNFRNELQQANPQNRFDERLHTTERFTLKSADTLWYRFTVEDPGQLRRSFSGEFPLTRTSKQIFEDGCHEGNYALANILRASRAGR